MSITTVPLASLSNPDSLVRAVTRALAPYQGRRFLGVIHGGDLVELVFDGENYSNLFSLLVRDGELEYMHGEVSDPRGYLSGNWNPLGER
jgi:hypothetical protein